MAATSVATYIVGGAVLAYTADQADKQRQARYDAKTAANNLQEEQDNQLKAAADKQLADKQKAQALAQSQVVNNSLSNDRSAITPITPSTPGLGTPSTGKTLLGS